MSQIGLHIIRIYTNVTIQCHGLTGNDSSRQRMFLGANTLECESSREREGQGAKVPGCELARVLLVDSLRRVNWPGSEKAMNPNNNY